MDKIATWEIDLPNKTAKPLEVVDRMDNELQLEDVLAENPDMLMPGLTIVGRQMPTDGGGGFLDLLGVDEDGGLVVFELKRGKTTRDAVGQIIDYCSWLEDLSEEALAQWIEENSGKNNTEVIKDFNEYYNERWGKNLRPARMALVSLSVDETARRMVKYLSARDLNIILLTFHGQRHRDSILLTRFVEEKHRSPITKQTESEKRNELVKRARDLGIEHFWRDVDQSLDICDRYNFRKMGRTFYRNHIKLDNGRSAFGSHSVVMESSDNRRRIRVTFYPAAIYLCHDKFNEKKKEIGFQTQIPPNAPTTDKITEEWYCTMDETDWNRHKQTLIELAEAVRDAWEETRRTPASP